MNRFTNWSCTVITLLSQNSSMYHPIFLILKLKLVLGPHVLLLTFLFLNRNNNMLLLQNQLTHLEMEQV